MRRLFALLLSFTLLLALPAQGEEGTFDLVRLEAAEGLFTFIDANGLDTVYRFSDQPFPCQISDEDMEANAFVDFVALALEGLVAARLTVSVISPESLDATELRVTVGKEDWRFAVVPVVSEYDLMFYEDYGVCLSDQGLPLLQAMADSRADSFAFALLQGEETRLTGEIQLPAQAAQSLYDLFLACGGSQQPLELLQGSWPLLQDEAP